MVRIGSGCRTAAGPLPPETLGAGEEMERVCSRHLFPMGNLIGKLKRPRFALRDDEGSQGPHPLAMDRHVAPQHQPGRSGHQRYSAIIKAADPWYSDAILKACREFALHLNTTLKAFDDPDDSGIARFRRHEIGDANASFDGRESRFEDQGARSIAPLDRLPLRGRQAPITVVFRSEQLCEATVGVKPW